MLVSEVGEEGLIRFLAGRLPRPTGETWLGDDAAIFPTPSDRVVFTTDTMVEGVDFDPSYCTGRDVGWKTVAINVSDVAAMGCRPTKALTTLCLPGSAPLAFVEEFVDGLLEAAAAYGVDLVGGDISSAPAITAGIALLGEVEGSPWLRSGAKPGDALVVTGSLGASGTGLNDLQNDPSASGPAVTRHLRPQARLAEADALRSTKVTAAIDLSDGLVIDLARMMRASGTGCEVDPDAIPVDPAASGLDAALFGGEDFELLLAVEADDVASATAAVAGCGTALTRIGVVTAGPAMMGGEPVDAMEERAWDHLRDR